MHYDSERLLDIQTSAGNVSGDKWSPWRHEAPESCERCTSPNTSSHFFVALKSAMAWHQQTDSHRSNDIDHACVLFSWDKSVDGAPKKLLESLEAADGEPRVRAPCNAMTFS